MTCKNHKKIMIVVNTLLILLSFNVWALDVVRVNKGEETRDIQTQYKMDVITAALELTKPVYGAYQITTQGPDTPIERAILEVNSGKTINTFFAITTQQWEDNTLPIRVPIRRGILNYRLLTIHKDKADLFKNIKSIDELKKLRVGLRAGWATTKLLQKQGFNVVESNSFGGLFYMLSSGRIDYIPRGLNEVYTELELRHLELPDLIVEPHLALHIPAPFYVFISPQETVLAERIHAGLEMMVQNKQLNQMFNKYYQEDIAKADLKNRQVFMIDNNDLPEKTPLNRKELWFENDK